MFKIVFRIRDILVRIRMRIRIQLFSSVTVKKCKKKIFSLSFYAFWRYIYIIL